MNRRFKTSSVWALAIGVVFPLAGCVIQEADVPADPEVSFPNWSADYNQERQVRVTAPAGWTIERVEYSVDGGKWEEATGNNAGSYTVSLNNLDIGDNVLAVRVESSYRGESQIDLFYDTIEGIASVFNCDAPGDSVLPSPDMIQDNGNEIRTMLGYFGDPNAGHTVTFMIDFTNFRNNDYEIVGSIINYGMNSITAEFDVGRATCDTTPNGDCNVPYALTVWVDGEQLCENGSFGNILNYANNPF